MENQEFGIKSKIRSFTDLMVWQESHKVVLSIYKITKNFPNEEIYGLTSQMRRAAVSVTSNIVEGFTRRSKKEKQQFYSIARGSLVELESQLFIARDISYITMKDFEEIHAQIHVAQRLLSAFVQSVNRL